MGLQDLGSRLSVKAKELWHFILMKRFIKTEKVVCVQQRLCTPCLECQNEESFIHLAVFLTADVRQSPFCPLKVRITTGHAAAEGTVTPGVTP